MTSLSEDQAEQRAGGKDDCADQNKRRRTNEEAGRETKAITLGECKAHDRKRKGWKPVAERDWQKNDDREDQRKDADKALGKPAADIPQAWFDQQFRPLQPGC